MIAVPAPPPPPAAALVTLGPAVAPRVLRLPAERLWPGSRTWIVRLPGGATPRALRSLRALPGVEAAEADAPRRRLGDPALTSQPYLPQVRWTPARPRGTAPLVAVLDTGVDAGVPALRGAVLTAEARSFVPGSPDPLTDREGHGTHVAALVATVAGGTGPRPGLRLLAVKIADRTGEATTSTLVRGIRYAVTRKARVINLSLGGAGFSPLEQEAVDEAVRSGALVVAAAGNTGASGNGREYPGAYRHVLGVGAVGADGRRLASSTRGPQVALAAPGSGILSAAPGGGYARLSGTSMASAIVAGAAARVMAARPRADASQVREALVRGVRPAAAGDGIGAGLLDVRAAIALTPPRADSPEPNDDAPQAATQDPLLASGGSSAAVEGRVETWTDPRDDYTVSLDAGETVTARLSGSGGDADLLVLRPGAPSFRAGVAFGRRWVADASVGSTPDEELTYTASSAGDYTLEVRALRGRVEYRLGLER